MRKTALSLRFTGRGERESPRRRRRPSGVGCRDGFTSHEDRTAEAARRLGAAAPDAKVILFGSQAQGNARPDSDLDLLVIEPKVKSRRAEHVRLREALGNLGVPIDLIVVPASHIEEWGHFEGTMLNDVLREGRVLVAPEGEGSERA